MPQIGEIKRGREIGFQNHKSPQVRSHKYIWQACAICHKERWVSLLSGGRAKSSRCKSCSRIGMENPNWKGKGSIDERGYRRLAIKKNDFFYNMACNGGKRKYIFEHRLVMAKSLGRCLHSWEIVHHRNGNKSDNRIENLQLSSYDKHNGLTILEREIKRLKAINKYLKGENICLKKQLHKASVSVSM